jgi:hypothetical protein
MAAWGAQKGSPMGTRIITAAAVGADNNADDEEEWLATGSNTTLYSWSWHHEPEVTSRLRRLKRDISRLTMFHLFDMSRRWILDFAESIESWTILRRFLPWAARGETNQAGSTLWAGFASQLTAICRNYDRVDAENSSDSGCDHRSASRFGAGAHDRLLTERFVHAAMDFIERLFAEQEAWEDRNMRARLPEVISRHNWRGRVGSATGWAAPAPAAAGPWFGRFRYTVVGNVASVHIHGQSTAESPFTDRAQLALCFGDMAKHIRRHEPQVTRIGTKSWLNCSAAYRAIFPPAYSRTLTREKGGSGVNKGFGAWGQFITAELQLNERRAAVLRDESRFVCVCVGSDCPLADFEQHVRVNLHATRQPPGSPRL